jgi:hypothetical protein
MKDINTDSDSPESEDSPPEEPSQGPELFLSEEEQRDTDSETEPVFEEQEGEVLPPEEKKKSGAGKLFLFLILILSGSGGYLYFNNLIPAEVLNLISPKSAPPKTSALLAEVQPTPLPVEEKSIEVAETPDTKIIAEEALPVAIPVAPQETTPGTKSSVEPISSTRISGNNFVQKPDIESTEEPEEEADTEESETAQDATGAQETISEPMTETPAPSYEEPTESPEPPAERDKSVQAYLDFIESSIQKLGELIKEGFNIGWGYIQKK